MIKSGKLEKLSVISYKDPKRQGKGEEMTFDFNPDQVSIRHENEFSRLRGINTSGRTAPFSKSRSELLSVQIILDNSIRVEKPFFFINKRAESITDQVKRFKALCAKVDGEIHEPRFLRVKWGTIDLECRLRSVEAKYTRFDRGGDPLRAELNAVFIADMPINKRQLQDNLQSPDITHTRIVRQGDTLTRLCKEVYGSTEHYLLVAQANQLNHFRRLTPGQEIFFPPLKP